MYIEIESPKLDDDITVGESISFASLEELNNKANEQAKEEHLAEVKKLFPQESFHNPDHVLEEAKGNYQDVLIIGWDKEGNFDVRSNSSVDGKTSLWLAQTFANKLLNGDYYPGDE